MARAEINRRHRANSQHCGSRRRVINARMKTGLRTLLLLGFCSFARPAAADDLAARVEALDTVAAQRATAATVLTLSGQVNRVLLLWDDGAARDAYIVDNIYSASRFNLAARTALSPDIATLASIEIESRQAASTTVSAGNDDGIEPGIRTRYAYWGIESKAAGRITLGQLAPLTNALVYYKLWELTAHTSPDALFNFSFAARSENGRQTGLTWSRLASGYETLRNDYVRYDSPSFGGLVLSGDFGDNDAWDAGFTFDRQFGAVKIAAAYGHFEESDEVRVVDDRASLLMRHMPSGVYGHLAVARRRHAEKGADVSTVLYANVGIKRPMLLDGPTLLYIEAARHADAFAGPGVAAPFGLPQIGASADDDRLLSSAVDRIGAGIMQSFAGDAVELYAMGLHYRPAADIGDGDDRVDAALRGWTGVVLGSRVKF